MDVQPQMVVDFILQYVDALNSEELQGIEMRSHYKAYHKGDLIYQQGNIPNDLCFLLKGTTRSFYNDDDGKEHTVDFGFSTSPIVPIGSFLEQVPSGISVQALEDIDVIWTSKQEYYSFLKAFPRLESGIAKLLGEYLLKEKAQLKLLRIGSSRERYEVFCALQPQVASQVPLKYVASYLGMALETLSRVRAGKL